MKKTIGFILFGFFAFLLSCEYNDTEYSIIPYIELRDFKFGKGDYDSLTLTFYLRDGDFDLGIKPYDTTKRYNDVFVYNKRLNKFLPADELLRDRADLIVYSDRKTIDTLPPLSCSRWRPCFSSDLRKIIDTVYVIPNRNKFDLNSDVYYFDSNKKWAQVDILNILNYPQCAGYLTDTFFPALSRNMNFGQVSYKVISSKEGIMTFTIVSPGLFYYLRGKTIKLNFSLQDRAQHRSNVVETNEVLIQ